MLRKKNLHLMLGGLMAATLSMTASAQVSEWTTFKTSGNNSWTPPVSDDGKCVTLTNTTQSQLGTMWFDNKLDLSTSFDLRVNMNFGDIFDWNGADPNNEWPEDKGGADGITFVIQDKDQNQGTVGNGIGYAGITPSIAVEFDSYYNPTIDPLWDHIAIAINGGYNEHTQGTPTGLHNSNGISADFLKGANSRGGENLTNLVVPAIGTDPADQATQLSDGNWHEARFLWKSDSLILEIWFDCELKIRLQEDIVNTIFNGSKDAFFGFTSATGNSVNIHEVCLFNTPKTDLSNDTLICNGNLATLTANVVDAPPRNITYEWTAIDPQYQNAISTPNTNQTVMITPPDTGRFDFQIEIFTTCYPFDEPVRDTITVVSTSANVDFTLPKIPPCTEETELVVDFEAELWGLYEYEIIYGDGNTSGVKIANRENISESYTYTAEGVYPAQVILKDVICDVTDTTKLDVKFVKGKSFSLNADVPEKVVACSPFEAQFSATAKGASTAIWHFGDNTSENVSANNPVYDASHYYTEPGQYQAMFIVTTDREDYCIKSDTGYVDVDIARVELVDLNVQVDGIPPCVEQDSVIVTFNTNNDINELTWIIDGDTTVGINSLTKTYTTSGTQHIHIISKDTVCDTQQEFHETFEINKALFLEDLIIPNVFTPGNNDGINDTWRPGFQNESAFPADQKLFKYTYKIFNRWGNKVVKAGDETSPWDGTKEVEGSKEIEPGVYFYQVDIESLCSRNEVKESKSGHVTILKAK